MNSRRLILSLVLALVVGLIFGPGGILAKDDSEHEINPPYKVAYVDDDTGSKACGGNDPCLENIQDALEIILNGGGVIVYPGDYKGWQTPIKNGTTGTVTVVSEVEPTETTIIEANDPTANTTIDILLFNQQPVTENYVRNLGVDSNSDYGIVLGGWDSKILGNIINGAQEEGITIYSNPSEYVSSGNEISNNTVKNSKSGIGLYSSGSNVIDDNTLTENIFGITISDSTSIKATENKVQYSEVGISLGSSHNNVLSDNTITGSGYLPSGSTKEDGNGIGIKLKNSDGNTLLGNTIKDSTEAGISLENSSGNELSGNTVLNSTAGILLDNSDSNLISQNDVSSQYGIATKNTSSSGILLNNIEKGEYGLKFETVYSIIPPPYPWEPITARGIGGGGNEVSTTTRSEQYETTVNSEYSLPGHIVYFNSITGNSEAGLVNSTASSEIDATFNWWGNAEGPTVDWNNNGTDEDSDYFGGGDKITSPTENSVYFSPWLGVNPDSDPDTPGVQLKSPLTFVVDDIGPKPQEKTIELGSDGLASAPPGPIIPPQPPTKFTLPGGYLNRAVFAVNHLPGHDTINILPGSYDGKSDKRNSIAVTFDESVTVSGKQNSDPQKQAIIDGNGNFVALAGIGDGSVVENLTVSNAQVGIWVSGANGFTIDNNTIGTLKDSDEYGPEKIGGVTESPENVLISNNTFIGPGINVGVALLGGTGHSVIRNDFSETEWRNSVAGNTAVSVGTPRAQLASKKTSYNQPMVEMNPTAGIYVGTTEHTNDTDTSEVSIIKNEITKDDFDKGIALYHNTSKTDVNFNVISGGATGILGNGKDNEAHFNSLEGNEFGVRRHAEGYFDATVNWWGDSSGPDHEEKNPEGKGSKVSDNVIFSPWLRINPDQGEENDKSGVQLPNSMQFVVDDAGPEPEDGYLHTALQASDIF
ncbi:MAG: NosD domain-containing protein, partial [Candidatus Bipolaricaulota bacterium]